MEVFCPPQFAPTSIEHGRRLENAVAPRTSLDLCTCAFIGIDSMYQGWSVACIRDDFR